MADIFDKAGNEDIFDTVQNGKPATIPTDQVPEWGRKNPNLYGVYGAGRELLRTGIETAGTTAGEAVGALVPVPGASYVGGGVGFAGSKRLANVLLGEDVDASAGGIGKDVAFGAAQAGVGKVISKIPGVKRILSPEAANVGVTPKGTGIMDKTAFTLAEKSLKVPPSVKEKVRNTAINTMLREKIPITKNGLARTKDMLTDLENQMDSVVAKNPNAPIKIDDVLLPINDLKGRFINTVNGDKLGKQIDIVVNNFKKQYGDVITVDQAQAIKQNTNAFLKKSYGKLSTASEETTKAIVRGLKDRIVKEIPEIAGVNLKYGELKTLETALERAVNRTGNWDWFSLSAGMAGSIVGGATGNVTKATEAVVMWRFLKSPYMQSQLALMFKKSGHGTKANAMANALANTIYHKMNPEEQQNEVNQ